MNATHAVFVATFTVLILYQAAYAEPTATQYSIAEIMMQKYTLEAEQQQFTVFYRFSVLEGVVEGGTEDLDAKLTSIVVDKERTSLVLSVENIRQTDLMSLRFPYELLSAEGERFTILADGQQRGYELSVHGQSTNLIFILPENTKQVEIIGTKVVPEFGSVILAFSVASLMAAGVFRKIRF
ncbi:MAG: hypothetical protein QXG67_03585 [Candidatus Nitrosotenuis sp.]